MGRLAFEATLQPVLACRVRQLRTLHHEKQNGVKKDVTRDENGTEIFRIDRFRFLYYEPFFNMKNCQFQLVSQLFSTIFCTL
jgi:hypothetical protein